MARRPQSASTVTPLWRSQLLLDGNGVPYANLANALIILRGDRAMQGALAFDEMRQSATVPKEPASAPGGKPYLPGFARQLTDDDVTRLQEWLQHCGLRKLGRETVGQAVHAVARDNRFHPVKAYLNGLVWDGQDRIGDLLTGYFGAEGNPEYLRAISRMFMISMVARIFKPGCKCDYMLILEGPQGTEKSKACAVLAGEWFSDHLPDIQTKDASQHLLGPWLIEVSELATFKRAESEPLKAFVSRTHERYRPPYGREHVEQPRQCVFIGSVNPKGGYLKDETGARRFWPAKIGKIDVEALQRDRDQLFAEAVERFNMGEHWWPDPAFEKLHIEPEQLARFEPDIWEQPIREFLRGKSRATVLEICIGALGYTKDVTDRLINPNGTQINRINQADTNRVTAALTCLDWEPKRDRTERWWQPK